MKKMIIIAAALLLGGCATVKKYEAKLNTWVGADENALIASWGVPNKEYQLSNGKKAIMYVHKDTIQTGGYTYITPQTTYQTGTIGDKSFTSTGTTYVTETSPVFNYNEYCKTTFIFAKNGRVEKWQHEGDNCVSK